MYKLSKVRVCCENARKEGYYVRVPSCRTEAKFQSRCSPVARSVSICYRRAFCTLVGGHNLDYLGSVERSVSSSGMPSSTRSDYKIDHAARAIEIISNQQNSDSAAITRIEVPGVSRASRVGARKFPRMAPPPLRTRVNVRAIRPFPES